MDSATNLAITAIRNIALESVIAESLHRMGWQLIYRATSLEGLEQVLIAHPDAVLIAADDFLLNKAQLTKRILWVNQSIGEYELQEQLRKLDQESPQAPTIKPLRRATVSVVATIDSGIGGSTLAINLAHEIAVSRGRTLLLDFNSFNPYLSRYFDIQRINRTFALTPFGFTIGEISDQLHFAEMALAAEEFDHVVIDLGRSLSAKELISGQRLQESLGRWALQSAQTLYLLARIEGQSIARLMNASAELAAGAISVLPTYVFVSQSAPSTRERRQILDNAKSSLSGSAYLLSRDVRNLSKAANERVPLAKVAPKSALAREISAIHRRVLNDER